MRCEITLAAGGGYPRNHSQTMIGWCSRSLCECHAFKLSAFPLFSASLPFIHLPRLSRSPQQVPLQRT